MDILGTDLVQQSLATEAIRAVESYRDEETRLYDDRVGVDLLPPIWRLFIRPMKFAVIRRPLLWYRERQVPGVIGSLVCRTRFIDDVLKRELRGELEQVVILGAGFDTRAYRIPGIEDLAVFEVDHLAPQEVKKKRVQTVFGSIPSHVTFVPVDFETDELVESMVQTTFEFDRRTLFIWEGVTQYLTERGVDTTLEAVSTAAENGIIVFTYISAGVIEGTSRTDDDEKVLELVSKQGTPWSFGLDPEQLDAFLEERGFSFEEDVGAAEYRDRYLDPINRHMNLYENERTAVATIERDP